MARLERIDGRLGLGNLISRLELEPGRDVFVFDFDRTLTNGFASPDQELDITLRIRGGSHTLDALRLLKRLGVEMYIVTARNPSRLTIEQLEASIQRCQLELGEFFLPSPDSQYVVESLENGMKLAHRGNLYASDYAKPNAIRHLLNRVAEGGSKRVVHFVDDFVGNSFDVAMSSEFGQAEVCSYWWDSFPEESAGEMGLVSSFSSDFTYQPGTQLARERFGLTGEESDRRLAWVLDYERVNRITKPPIEVEKPVVKKKDLSAFQGLTFGVPRRLPE
ncbi:hypothetical protein BASA81_003094 [Batrachochytrium salamandrivorans]|nr:hypothetical protein BASA81_003094 [Batrachochytrium salamandrivorans]